MPTQAVLRDHTWQSFKKILSNSDDIIEQKEFMESLGRKLGFKSMNNWYNLSSDHFTTYGGTWLLIRHNNSPIQVVESVFNDHKWYTFLFSTVPRNYWTDQTNHRNFMEYLGERLEFKHMEDWYKISQDAFLSNGGTALLSYYDNSPIKVVESIFSTHKWQLFLFEVIPKGYWSNYNNQKDFMIYLGDKLGFKSMEDWYKISLEDFVQHKGRGLLSYYKHSPIKAVESIFTTHKWQIFLFDKVPTGYWNEVDNQKEYMVYLGDKLGFKVMEDWYKISQDDFYNNSGNSLLTFYKGSPIIAVESVFNTHKWEVAKFFRAPHRHWVDSQRGQGLMQHIGDKLGFKSMEDWYKVTYDDFAKNGGSWFLSCFKNSPIKIVKSVFNNHKWHTFLFESISKNYWKNVKNQREFMEYIGDKLGLKSLEDWYTVFKKDLLINGGKNLLSHYNNSLIKALVSIFKEHRWHEFQFETVPWGYWVDPKNQKNYMDYLGDKLGFKSMADWYKISQDDFNNNGGRALLSYYKGSPGQCVMSIFPEENFLYWLFNHQKGDKFDGHYRIWLSQVVKGWEQRLSLTKLDQWKNIGINNVTGLTHGQKIISNHHGLQSILRFVYPSQPWEEWEFRRTGKKATQKLLASLLQIIFPDEEIKVDFRHADLIRNDKELELDIFIPSLNLAFEYNGHQHYIDTLYFGPCAPQKERDQERYKMYQNAGITLIVIPYWWARDLGSLKATIYQFRPDLVTPPPQNVDPIPAQNPHVSPLAVPEHEAIIASKMMGVVHWSTAADPTNWYLSEKYNGIRAYWDGRQFYAKNGKEISVPDWFTDGIPQVPLDGELWDGGDCSSDSVYTSIKPKNNTEYWRNMKYMVFDLPSSSRKFKDRLTELEILKFPDHLILVENVVCKGRDHLDEFFSRIVAKGGEGVTLRNPNRKYIPGVRSRSLMCKLEV